MTPPSGTTTSGPQPTQHRTLNYYHASPLFTLAELHTNTLLAAAIRHASHGRYNAVLPQNLEQRDTSPHAIRDADIKALLACDLALFTYDGTEVDSGTVVEYMLAKFGDVPAVILRTDFRGAGDQGGSGDAWNLMSSFWPRTRGVVVSAMGLYKAGLIAAAATREFPEDIKVTRTGENVVDPQVGASRSTLRSGELMVDSVAEAVVKAMDAVVSMPARLPEELREAVYEWLALMPGFKDGGDAENVAAMMQLLARKERRGLF